MGPIVGIGVSKAGMEGAALKNSLDQRSNVAVSGSPENWPDSAISALSSLPVGVGAVMVLADLDVIEQSNSILGR